MNRTEREGCRLSERCEIRTRDLRLRRPTLYPAELIARRDTSTTVERLSRLTLDGAARMASIATALTMIPESPIISGMETLILASTSPRRSQLLQSLNIPFLVMDPNIDESRRDELPPMERVVALAEDKARAAAKSAEADAPQTHSGGRYSRLPSTTRRSRSGRIRMRDRPDGSYSASPATATMPGA